MPENASSKNSPIIIVGAGVFGLTTALHLSQRGYTNIHIFDKQQYDANGYSTSKGCDAASADENKILRASYGGHVLYQSLAFEAMKHWDEWNKLIASEPNLPQSLSNSDKLWENCGFLRIGDHGLEQHELDTQDCLPPDIKHTQYRITDSQRISAALNEGLPAQKLDPFERRRRGLPTDGVFDSTAGFVLASKACAFALHLCAKRGVRLSLGPGKGEFISFMTRGKSIEGIVTKDGKSHPADLVIVAAGGWTPSLVPQVDRLLEATAGSIVTIQLPRERTELWDKYSAENFPVWSWKMAGYDPETSTGGLYGLPRTKDGLIKFGFRGAKWTNHTWRSRETGKMVSYPRTDLGKMPQKALDVVRAFCKENMPELLELPLLTCRLCWYTDSVDNSFLIDRVPGVTGLMVASGGSGHGFKFLPVLGKHVVDIIEGKDTPYAKEFAWRSVPEGNANGLEEGQGGWRTLDKQRLVGAREWKL